MTKHVPKKPTKPKKPKKTETHKSHQQSKLFKNLSRVTEQFIKGKSFVPLTFREFMARLGFPAQHEDIFKEILKEFERQGVIAIKAGRYVLESKDEVYTGVIHMHPRGFGFVTIDDPSPFAEDVFIPKHLSQNAVDGDTVEIAVNPENFSEKGPEGQVIAIVSRGRTHMAGIISEVLPNGDTYAYVPLLGVSQRVYVEPTEEKRLAVGDRVVMEVIEWGGKGSETVGRFSHYLGHITDASCDVPAAIEEYELRNQFPTKAVKEAQAVGTKVPVSEIAKREDLRELETFTIDPDTAKDFDDALSLSKDKHGKYHLAVHIADVSHYVLHGTALDKEARKRCNSTYFPGKCIPMLPPELSDNLCSLKPKVNRLTITVFMTFDKEGELKSCRMAKTVIHSAKRFTYKEAKQVLDGKKKSKHAPTLHLMVELCKLLKKKRYERGSIEFSLPETVVIVDEKGEPQGTEIVEYDITHQLVEEFMLKANEQVAFHLSELNKNLTYRIHDEPSPENLKDFSILASAFGFELSEVPTPKQMQQLFDEALTTSYGPFLATSYIRRMRLAQYSADNIGHYGLGLTHYCHFTSPIRRYVDLVVHRILFGEADVRETIEQIAQDCSEQERISSKAEGSVLHLKKLRLIDKMAKESPHRQFNAIVTRVKPFGFFFEVLDLMLEGFIHVSELGNDYYAFSEESMELRGVRHGGTYKCGEQMVVMLKDVDFIYRECKWDIVLDWNDSGGEQRRGDANRKREGKRTGKRRDGKSKRKKR